MFDRPIAQFVAGALLGVIASFSISFGLVAVVAAVAIVVLVAVAWKSHAALAGGLCGFGLTWLVVGGSTYLRCVAMGPDCIGSEGFVPFLMLAGVIFTTGVAVGVSGIVRDRGKRQGPRA